MDAKALSDIRRKKKVLDHAEKSGNISATCRYFGICRETFYEWKRLLAAKGEVGLINSKPCPANPKIRVAKPIEIKILYLRRTYHLGQQRMSGYLAPLS